MQLDKAALISEMDRVGVVATELWSQAGVVKHKLEDVYPDRASVLLQWVDMLVDVKVGRLEL